MGGNIRNRNEGMSSDWKSCDHYEDIGIDWILFACAEEKRQPIMDLVARHYKDGTRRPTKLHKPIRGGYNANWRVEFEDDSAMLHIPLPGQGVFLDEKVRAEVATMKLIEARTTIPVPHIYHWGYAADNPSGLGPFIIMDYIEHEKDMVEILKHEDQAFEYIMEHGIGPHVSESTLLKAYRQMANILLQLSTLEMPYIGSPAIDESSGDVQISGRPVPANMNEMITGGGNPFCGLPAKETKFATAKDYYSALADMHLSQFAFQYNHAITGPNDCRDKYVARQLFRRLAKTGELGGPEDEQQPFKLWCDDFRQASVLLNEENDVVGVIDWEFSYSAPTSFSYDPPWWIIMGKCDFWDKGIEDFFKEFDRRVPLFLRAIEMEEEEMRRKAEDEQSKEDDSALASYLEDLDLADKQPKTTTKLSDRMRKNWEDGRHYINYDARKSWAFDPLFWGYIDQRFFGENSAGGFEGRLHLFSQSEREKMEDFVQRKIEQSEDEKLKNWDEDECREYLETLLKDD